MEAVIVRRCERPEPAWLALRAALWPQASATMHREDALALLASEEQVVVVAEVDGRVTGFAEASLRHEHVNGTSSSPVAFLEGLYVTPTERGRGIGRHLVEAVEAWARGLGCRELASDALADNQVGIRTHLAVGFEETERVVFFRKGLDR